jgi:hypothetical protein
VTLPRRFCLIYIITKSSHDEPECKSGTRHINSYTTELSYGECGAHFGGTRFEFRPGYDGVSVVFLGPSTGISGVLPYVGSEVLTPVVMKCSIFWDVTPCSPLEVNSACHLL